MDKELHGAGPNEEQVLKGVWAKVCRVAYLLSMASFALPFVVLRSCNGEDVGEYTGFGLIADGIRSMLIVFLMGVALLGMSFAPLMLKPALRGAAHAGRAFLAEFAALLVYVIHGTALVGMWICGVSWLFVYVVSLGLAASSSRLLLKQAPELRPRARRVALWVFGILLVGFGTAALADRQESVGASLGAALVAFLLFLPLGVACYFVILDVLQWRARD